MEKLFLKHLTNREAKLPKCSDGQSELVSHPISTFHSSFEFDERAWRWHVFVSLKHFVWLLNADVQFGMHEIVVSLPTRWCWIVNALLFIWWWLIRPICVFAYLYAHNSFYHDIFNSKFLVFFNCDFDHHSNLNTQIMLYQKLKIIIRNEDDDDDDENK